MTAAALTLADWLRPMVRLACEQCGRRGQYQRAKLIAEYGADMPLPELRHALARSPRRYAQPTPCGVVFEGLLLTPKILP
jgi:hypothetical protein